MLDVVVRQLLKVSERAQDLVSERDEAMGQLRGENELYKLSLQKSVRKF